LAVDKGYTVLKGRQAIMSAKPGSGKIWAVGANGYLPYAIDRSENDVSLAEFVQQAITLLDNEKGFFIMAEGGKIDVVCHANDAGTALHETLDFNDAVKVAYEFALKHPDETLIVVTGDHETGGLQLGFAGTGYKSGTEYLQLQKCSIDKLDELLAQIANGKDKVVFDDVKGLINQYFGMYFPGQKMPEGLHFELNDKEVKELEKAFNRQYPNGKYKKGRIMSPGIIRCFNAKCSLSWTTGGHTAMPVLTSAYGKKAEMFTGLLDNTEISRKLKQVVR